MSEMIKIFQSARYGRTGLSPTQAATDTLIYVLFHEWGHALLDMYALPIQADKEEDIADHFATTMLLKHFEGGAEIAMSTADMFDIASRYYARDKENYYWDEHSLDIVRSRNLLCHVYGSDPKRYQHLAQHHSHLRQRSKDCVHRYQHLLKTWGIQLAPYVTPTIQATKQSRTAKSTAAPKRKPSVVIKPKFLNYTPR